jgi:putative ABC transport system permease protein
VIALLASGLVGIAVHALGHPALALGTAAGILGSLLPPGAVGAGIRALSRRLRAAAGSGAARRCALRSARSAARGRRRRRWFCPSGLGLAVLASVGQIDANLRAAIQRDLPQVAPSYFFVDIQPDQLQPFLDRVENDPAVSRVDTAPMLRGIISRINGERARTWRAITG